MTADGQVAELVAEVGQLRDLFHRRLLEDKAKARLYDELYEQLAIARGGLAEQLLGPIFRELLLVIDRVSALSTGNDRVLDSICEELLELLERQDVHPLPEPTSFDPAVHEAVGTEAVADRPPGSILEVVRPGFVQGAKLLRPARVVVAVPPPALAESTSMGHDSGVAAERTDPGRT